jgi:hypothetical protein
MSLKIAPIAFVLLAILVSLFFYRSGWKAQGRGPTALFLAVPIIAFAISYTATRRNLNRLLAQPAPIIPSAVTTGDAIGTPQATLSPEYQALMNIPAPRTVRMARRATMNLVMPMGVVLIFETILLGHLYFTWAPTHSFAALQTKDWVAMGLAILLLFIPLSLWSAQVRERDLLKNGEIALAKVVKQWSVRNGASIVYEFTDFEGQTRRQGGFDYTGKLYEGTSVPVFYDRGNPKRQVAACSALHEVVTPEG